MISPDSVSQVLFETFEKGAVSVLSDWLKQHCSVKRWILAADFMLDDNKNAGHCPANNCFAFTLFPDSQNHSLDIDNVNAQLPSDIKNSSTLTDNSARWLKDDRYFHFIIPVPKHRPVFGKGKEARKVAKEAVALVQDWLSDKQRGRLHMQRIKLLKQKMLANSFSVALFADVFLLSLLFPTLTLMCAQQGLTGNLCWTPDRDKMIEFARGVIWTLALENLLGLSEKMLIPLTGVKVRVPDQYNDEDIKWLDSCIRPPDWFAGTLAMWDRVSNVVPGNNDKYLCMLEKVIADAKNVIILPLNLDESGVQASRLVVSRTEINTARTS